jgi:hypothetical protein
MNRHCNDSRKQVAPQLLAMAALPGARPWRGPVMCSQLHSHGSRLWSAAAGQQHAEQP